MRSRRSLGRGDPANRLATVRRTVVLDSDGVVKILRGDVRVAEMIDAEVVQAGSRLVAPAVVLVEVARAGLGRALLDGVADRVHDLAPVDLERARLAAALLDRASREADFEPGVVDALVAAEALRSVPSIVITSDPTDLRRLCDADPSLAARVAIWRS